MNRRVVVGVSLMVVLLVLNLTWPEAPSPLSASSFGRSGSGHGAVFDLLSELDLNAGRSLETARRLAGDRTVWWIDPLGVCDGRIAMAGEVDVLDARDVAWAAGDWIARGGTAVVFLQSAQPGGAVPPAQEELVSCDAVAGFPVPGRSRFRSAGDIELGFARANLRGRERRQIEPLEPPSPAASVTFSATGASRLLAQSSPFAFDALPGAGAMPDALPGEPSEDEHAWTVAAEIRGADGRVAPFALERRVGEGRLVVVADSGFTHNRWLDAGDSARLVLDFVERYGVPHFDEREHGFLPETSAVRYIAKSRAMPMFVGLAALGLVFAWRGAAFPARSVQEFDPAAPTLETFVGSMTGLYAKTRDHAEVLARYRELVAGRIRRHFGLPPEVSREALAERIRRAGSLPAARLEALSRLTDAQQVASEGELARAVNELDQLAGEITR